MKAGIWQHHMFCGQQIVTILQHRWMIFYWRHTPYSRQLPTLFFSLFQLLKLLLSRRRLVGRLSCPSVLFFLKYVLLCLQPNSHWTRVISQVRALQLRNKKYRSNESSVILFLTSQWASHVFPGLNASFRWKKKLQVDLWWPFPAIVQAHETNQIQSFMMKVFYFNCCWMLIFCSFTAHSFLFSIAASQIKKVTHPSRFPVWRKVLPWWKW